MIVHGNEVLEPQELADLGTVFDETWAVLRSTVGDDAEQRMALACILLRLAQLKQLGPEQMKATALRRLCPEPNLVTALPKRVQTGVESAEVCQCHGTFSICTQTTA